MTKEVIKELLDTAPYVPFTVHMADGRAVTIQHPDFAVVSHGGRTLVVNTEGEKWAYLDLLLVLRAEREPAPEAAQPQ